MALRWMRLAPRRVCQAQWMSDVALRMRLTTWRVSSPTLTTSKEFCMFFQRLKDELPDPAPTAQTDLWYFRTLLCELRNEVSYKHLVVVLAAHLNDALLLLIAPKKRRIDDVPLMHELYRLKNECHLWLRRLTPVALRMSGCYWLIEFPAKRIR